MSTNVDDYTVDELMSILGIDTLTEENVENACGEFIQRFEGSSSNEEIVTFFQNIESKLLEQIELDNDNENVYENEIDNQDSSNPVSSSGNVNDWYGNTYLQQGNQQQKDKITQRENKVQLFDNGHVPMNREQLGVTNNYQVKVGQDTLNPVLQNTISRYIVIDSQYRQSTSGDGYTLNSDFTLDLSEHMVNVLSIRLSAIQIPFSWFNINSARNYFYIYNKEDNGSGVYQDEYYLIKIEEGNYDTIDSILTAINAAFTAAGFIKTGIQNFIYLNNGKVFIDLYDTTINGKPLYYFDDIPSESKNISGIFFYKIFSQKVHNIFT
jgi:hypothetical protein